MQRGILVAAPALLGLALSAIPVHADEYSYPYQGRSNYQVDGFVRAVDYNRDRIIIAGDDGRAYTADTFGSDIILRAGSAQERTGQTGDLNRGMRVEAVGTLLGRSLLETDRIRVLPPGESVQSAALVRADSPRQDSEPLLPTEGAQDVMVEGQITRVNAAQHQVTLLSDDDQKYTADMRDSDIVLLDAARSGVSADLVRGMRIRLIGTQSSRGLLADRIRVLPGTTDPSPDTAAAAVEPTPALPVKTASVQAVLSPPIVARALDSLDSYTGIVIDARDFPEIRRSPAPAIYGPDMALLYPDRSHVPTPDEVQDESIVRYYRTEGAAMDGVGGEHPLILHAVAVIGPAQDGLQLSADDAALFQALDKKLRFTRSWKVGCLIPSDE